MISLDDDEVSLVVDGTNLLNRVMFAAPLYSLEQVGSPALAPVYGFLVSLRGYLEKYRVRRCVVVWDLGRSKRRLEIFPDYKRNRAPVDLEEQVKAAERRKVLDNAQTCVTKLFEVLGLHEAVVPGREGDDTIWLVRQLLRKFDNVPVMLLTEDRDFYQMIDENTFVGKFNKDLVLTSQNLIDHAGVEAHEYVIYRSMTGDAGDGIPGIKGIGPKTGSTIVREALRGLTGKPDWAAIRIALENYQSTQNRIATLCRRAASEIDRVKLYYELIQLGLEQFEPNEILDIKDAITKPLKVDKRSAIQKLSLMKFHGFTRNFTDWIRPFERIRCVNAS